MTLPTSSVLNRETQQRFFLLRQLARRGDQRDDGGPFATGNFTEGEVACSQSEPEAMTLRIARHPQGFRARRPGQAADGIPVKVDLIVGLPGRTRRSCGAVFITCN